MKGQNFKDFESQTRTPQNLEEFNGVRKKLGEYGIQATEMIGISDSINKNKDLVTYLIFKCRRVWELGLTVVYYSQTLGYIIHMRESDVVFIRKSVIDTNRLGRLDDKNYYRSIK